MSVYIFIISWTLGITRFGEMVLFSNSISLLLHSLFLYKSRTRTIFYNKKILSKIFKLLSRFFFLFPNGCWSGRDISLLHQQAALVRPKDIKPLLATPRITRKKLVLNHKDCLLTIFLVNSWLVENYIFYNESSD